MPPKSSAGQKRNTRRASGGTSSQGANNPSERQAGGAGPGGGGQGRQAVQGQTMQPQPPIHNQPAQRTHGNSPPFATNVRQRNPPSSRADNEASDAHETGPRTALLQRSGLAATSQQVQEENRTPEGGITPVNEKSNPVQQRRTDGNKTSSRPAEAAMYLLPRHREKPLLPEPALTAILPKQEKQEVPAEENSGLSILAAAAEEHGRMFRLGPHQHDTTVPMSEEIRQENENYMRQGNPGRKLLPSFSRIRSTDQPRLEDPTRLPPVKQVIQDMVDQTYRVLSDEQKAILERDREAQRQERLKQENANRRLIEGPQMGNKNEAPNVHACDSRSASQGTSNGQNPAGDVNTSQGARNVATPRTVNARRLRDRGHKNGFVSFGDYVQADMPSSSLSHFSISKRPRITYSQNVAPRPSFRQPEKSSLNIFQAFLGRPDLVITLAKHLRVQELLTLYSICRPFHDIVKLRLTTVVVAQAVLRAPESARIFPFRCYKRLCVEDPAKRPHPVPEKAAAGQVRKVPSFRWLRMVCFREVVCHEIMTIMAEDGVPLPDACEPVIKKIWFLMDLPDNMRRIGMIQNREIFSDSDIFFATLFFVKMDMRFTDPLTGSGKDGMRRLLMAQPGLSMFWRTLKRTALVSKLDVVKLFIRWKWQPRETESTHGLLGIPPSEIGIVQYEGWGRGGSRVPLERPDALVLLESIRRELRLDEKYPDMFLWGYVNPNTMEDFPPIERKRELDRMEGWEEDLEPREDKGKVVAPKRISTRVIQN